MPFNIKKVNNNIYEIYETYRTDHSRKKDPKYFPPFFKLISYDPKRFNQIGYGAYHIILKEDATNMVIKIPRLALLFGHDIKLVMSEDRIVDFQAQPSIMRDVLKDQTLWNQIYTTQDKQAYLVNSQYFQSLNSMYLDIKEELPFAASDFTESSHDQPFIDDLKKLNLAFQDLISQTYDGLSFLQVPFIDGFNGDDLCYQLRIEHHYRDEESEILINHAITDELLRIYATTGSIIYDGYSENFLYTFSDNPVKVTAHCIDIDCAKHFQEEPSACNYICDVTRTALALKLLSDVVAGQEGYLFTSLKLASVRNQFSQFVGQIQLMAEENKLSAAKSDRFNQHYKDCILPFFANENGLMLDGIKQHKIEIKGSRTQYKPVTFHPIMQIELQMLHYLKEKGGRQLLCSAPLSLFAPSTCHKQNSEIKMLKMVFSYIASMDDTPESYEGLKNILIQALEQGMQNGMSQAYSDMLNHCMYVLSQINTNTEMTDLRSLETTSTH